MTCISSTASIDYVLVSAVKHILAALSFISFCTFLCFAVVFSLLCLLYIVLLVVFLLIFSHVKINLFLKKKVIVDVTYLLLYNVHVYQAPPINLKTSTKS